MQTERRRRARVKAPATVLPEGLVVAPIRPGGAWNAICELRAAMRALAASGEARATYLAAVDDEGREVQGVDPAASILLLGYES